MNKLNLELKYALGKIGIKVQRLEEPEKFEMYTDIFCKDVLFQMNFEKLHHWKDKSNDWYAIYTIYTFFSTEPTAIYFKNTTIKFYKDENK